MTGSFVVRRLAEGDASDLEAFLRTLPPSHLYLRAAAREPSSFVAALSDERIVAVAQSNAPPSLVVAGDPAGLAAIARDRRYGRGAWRVLVGRDAEARAWLEADADARAVVRLHRYLVLDAVPAGRVGEDEVERATAADLDALVRLSFTFHRDDDPAGAAPREPRLVEARNRARIAAGTSWVIRRGDDAVFMADVGVEEPNEGALLGGIVTDRAWRRRGLGRAGLASVCRRLCARGAPRIALHVAEENVAARALYESVGFREIDVFRVAYRKPPAGTGP